MKYIFLFCLIFNFSYAHKINLFVTNENDTLEIYSYFASGNPCKSCKLLIKNEDKIILEDVLNEEGRYIYRPTVDTIEIVVDASGGHIAKEKLVLSNIKQENLQTHIKEEENKKYFNILLGLTLIFLVFLVLKKVKK